MNKLVWFRNDLRMADNPALDQACRDAGDGQVVAVAAITPGQWARQDESPGRVAFWRACLEDLAGQLRQRGIALKLIEAQAFAELPDQFVRLAETYGADTLYYNFEYPLYERRRDQQIKQAMQARGIAVRGTHGDLVIAPDRLRTGQGGAYRVFTPFSKAWRQQFCRMDWEPLPVPAGRSPVSIPSDSVPQRIDYPLQGGPWQSDLWPAGSEAAHRRLQEFVEQRAGGYGRDRDYPALPATSALSPYLSVGALSVRQCLAALRLHTPETDWLAHGWVTELIWREFYRHLLVNFPELNAWKPFRPQVESSIRWQPDAALFEAWSRGETGYPLVDAGMRQLLESGWMHNRLRMVTASFLTKLLRQDWRQGARFFMRHLLDGDFASNLGGWQWCASVGADAAPYFRIFNPQRQGERFDPEGVYVARWLPQLQPLTGKQRHDPAWGVRVGRPEPVIDYKRARTDSLDDYNARR